MTSQLPLIDPQAQTRRRARATPEALFLHAEALAEIKDRLGMVKKAFTAPAIVTNFPDVWRSHWPDAVCVPADETLALSPGAHDLVIHAMALHWANDPVGQIIQCRRALKPDGLFMSVAFGGQTLHELRACLGQAEVAVAGGLSPRIAPMGEVRDLGALLQRAGLALPVADTLPLRVTYADAWSLMRDLRAMGEGNALRERLRRPTRRAVFDQAAALYKTHFADDEGRIPATFELIFLTGWAPDDSQPKPLRPGSAQHRLAEALGTAETKLPN